MQLKAFKVKMYRPILDSGWVDVEDVTAIIGKNESGKTSLLKALHKFNPYDDVGYDLNREWPRTDWKDRASDKDVVVTRFALNHAELKEIDPYTKELPELVEITKTYEGTLKFEFPPKNDIFPEVTLEDVFEHFDLCIANEKANFPELVDLIDDVYGIGRDIINDPESYDNVYHITDLANEHHHPHAPSFAAGLILHIETALGLVNLIDAKATVEQIIADHLPIFVYMDEHRPFQGRADLNEIKYRKDADQLTAADHTFLTMLNLAGIDFDEEFDRIDGDDEEERMIDMKMGSKTFTDLLARHWSQRNYNVEFNADRNTIIVFVTDNIQKDPVALDERSAGFQWFFSFDTTLLYETKATFENAIVLLDEPGLHLHAAAQEDLLARLREYAKGNQLIYTTHMPFMIDMQRIESIRVCTEDDVKGSTVTKHLFGNDKRELMPLQAALGLTLSQSPLFGEFNLVVEGVTDVWFLNDIAAILRDEVFDSLDERIVITPGNSASRAAYLTTLLHWQGLNTVVLFDSDRAGREAADELVKKWNVDGNQVLLTSKTLGIQRDATIEDVLTETFYLEYVNKTFEKILGSNLLTSTEINAHSGARMGDRIENTFRHRGFGRNTMGKAFNKSSVARLIAKELRKLDRKDIFDALLNNFSTLFKSINGSMSKLSAKADD